MIAEFWKEMGERLEEGEIGEDILVQLGVLMGGRAYTLTQSCGESGGEGLGEEGGSEE